jgi:hypothetical protein
MNKEIPDFLDFVTFAIENTPENIVYDSESNTISFTPKTIMGEKVPYIDKIYHKFGDDVAKLKEQKIWLSQFKTDTNPAKGVWMVLDLALYGAITKLRNGD